MAIEQMPLRGVRDRFVDGSIDLIVGETHR